MSIKHVCATCTHWDRTDRFEEWERDAADHGMTGWRRCRFLESTDTGGYTTRNHRAQAFAYCGDTYVGASLYTAPSFGCTQWEGDWSD